MNQDEPGFYIRNINENNYGRPMRIKAIAALRHTTTMGLRDAVDVVDAVIGGVTRWVSYDIINGNEGLVAMGEMDLYMDFLTVGELPTFHNLLFGWKIVKLTQLPNSNDIHILSQATGLPFDLLWDACAAGIGLPYGSIDIKKINAVRAQLDATIVRENGNLTQLVPLNRLQHRYYR